MVSSRLLTGAVLAFGLALGSSGLALADCGSSSSLNGTYHQAGGGGIVTLEFNSCKVTMTMMGESKQGTYDIKGDGNPINHRQVICNDSVKWRRGTTS